ncbi:alpha/beta hydrolase [Priestia flexa]|uniref:alpha/beta hydrolase n=1 Tax=Priestia flexa TaxID=86664 RepID=UPI001B32818B|nr:alpha/beta hydrolase [Priestia flexa]
MMHRRFFSLDTQWNVVHVPEKPNGFGVLVLGDKDHFVESSTSLWIQHGGRSQLLQYLQDEGYTVFYSNLYGRHWGSPKANRLAKQLYHLIMKQEILNKRIHILAEGMGALLAMQLMEGGETFIRSVALLNPCIDLHTHASHEKQNKFFYKQFTRDMTIAYDVERKQVAKMIAQYPTCEQLTSTLPVKIWTTANEVTHYPLIHSKQYEQHRLSLQSPISLSLYLMEKKYLFERSLLQFYKLNEKVL